MERHHEIPHHSFEWEGIDGSRILTHFPPSDTYGSTVSMQELQYSQRNFLDKDLSRNAILLYGYSDGGGGPTREMVARIRRDHDLAGARASISALRTNCSIASDTISSMRLRTKPRFSRVNCIWNCIAPH